MVKEGLDLAFEDPINQASRGGVFLANCADAGGEGGVERGVRCSNINSISNPTLSYLNLCGEKPCTQTTRRDRGGGGSNAPALA